MAQQPFPVWMKPALDDRFIELTRLARKQEEVKKLHQQQSELEDRMKDELTVSQFQAILEWGEISNHRNTLEKEWIFLEGMKDGMEIIRRLHNVISS